MQLQAADPAHPQDTPIRVARPAHARFFGGKARLLLPLLLLWAALLPQTVAVATDDGAPTIVIHEIHYEPADARAMVEFVELYNAS